MLGNQIAPLDALEARLRRGEVDWTTQPAGPPAEEPTESRLMRTCHDWGFSLGKAAKGLGITPKSTKGRWEMAEQRMTEKLDFLIKHRQQDEATLLAQAVRAGIEALYRESLIDGYLSQRLPRERLLREIGLEALEEIEFQRDCLQRDVEWGLKGV